MTDTNEDSLDLEAEKKWLELEGWRIGWSVPQRMKKLIEEVKRLRSKQDKKEWQLSDELEDVVAQQEKEIDSLTKENAELKEKIHALNEENYHLCQNLRNG